ncbi:hypothetical protein M378DRAFT_103072 [Amanita muscaria Koide BX008]|uniref:Enoyl reductase (ER) domain-containing protein n=1 Tax=Amanita muscaria (strain Koide BX008) TaxID=946122 RepID=A0A0C2WYF0_AMAMK|nr:hypothetical protein M378DRAFT_103072 [Amanita muscaria Koide BX008]
MAEVKNGRIIFNSIPTGYPEPGKTVIYDNSKTINLEKTLDKGTFLLKTLVVSIDPYLRGQMRDKSVQSYSKAFTLGEPIFGYGVGLVLRSNDAAVRVGDHVYGTLIFAEYHVYKLEDISSMRILDNKHNLPWSVYVGVAGMPGQTAYLAWKLFSQAKKGETAFITAGAGPVGSLVTQLAKRDGLKVIGAAGSPEKISFVKSIGADVVFNYKETDVREVLKEEGPVDIYWDNVGGAFLEAALEYANVDARFLECGMISSYNEPEKPIKGMSNILVKSITMHGFIVSRLAQKHPELLNEFYEKIPALLAKGEIKYTEDVTRGLDKVGDVLLSVQKGTNKGKAVVLVAED